MRYSSLVRLLASAVIVPAALAAQDPTPDPAGQQVFETMPNGAIIELRRAADDSAGMQMVRTRLRALSQALSQGDLSSPAFARLTSAPGMRAMIERRSAIRYDYRELPRGAALRITSTDAVARRAIWEFVVFERNEQLAVP